MCELKCLCRSIPKDRCSHTLTGVWVEIIVIGSSQLSGGHTLTGVWVEIQHRWTLFSARQSHTLTGVWVEISAAAMSCRSRRSHPHGCVSWNVDTMEEIKPLLVTPSRVCELKSTLQSIFISAIGHTLTGVWVEMLRSIWSRKSLCHTLTGVWVEIYNFYRLAAYSKSHPHGCVSWNSTFCIEDSAFIRSHPHGCVSWNPQQATLSLPSSVTPSRVCELKSATGCEFYQAGVTPSRVCELKFDEYGKELVTAVMSHPHGCVSWNYRWFWWAANLLCHTLTGVWVEICSPDLTYWHIWSHPHGCVSWNLLCPQRIHDRWSHTLTGVWVEIFTAVGVTYAENVTPSRVCELKYNGVTYYPNSDGVTPSRVCELKYYKAS